MTVLEYVIGALIILVSALIIVLVLFQESKKRGLSGAIGGTSSDSFFGKNQGQTKEKKLSRLTTIACAVFAVVAIAAYIICS
jgi:preprotein translocase subunit SecG